MFFCIDLSGQSAIELYSIHHVPSLCERCDACVMNSSGKKNAPFKNKSRIEKSCFNFFYMFRCVMCNVFVCNFILLFCYISAYVHFSPTSNVSFDILFHSNRLGGNVCMV